MPADEPSTPNDEIRSVVEQVSSDLSETNSDAMAQIESLISVAGVELVQSILQETLEIERNGGMMLFSGKRRRTPGGVFFFLAKQKLTPEQQVAVFGKSETAKKERPAEEKSAERPAAASQAVPETAPAPARAAPEPVIEEPLPELEVTTQSRQIAQGLARQLKETDPEKIESMARIVQVVGLDLARVTLEITLDMESQGGLRKKDGTRRSPGSSFMYITSRRMSAIQRRQVWPVMPEELIPPTPTARLPAPPPSEARTLEIKLPPRPTTQAGVATTAKITLVGRPSEVQRKIGHITFQLLNSRLPSLPKGLPPLEINTVYTIFVAEKQWSKVATAAENPEDAIIIEGYPLIDAKNPGIVVLASNVFTKLSQQTRKSPRGD